MLDYWISNLLYIRCFFILKKDKDILRFLCIPKVPLYSSGEDFYKFNAFKLRMNEGNWLSHKRYAYIQPNLTTNRIPFTPMGVLAPGSTHARSSARAPIDMSGNFRRTCLQSHLQTSPPTPYKSYLKFWNPRTTFENTPLCPPKYSIVWGVGGVPDFFMNSSIFIFLGCLLFKKNH